MSLPRINIPLCRMESLLFIIRKVSKRIKIGKIECQFLQFLHTKSGENETFS